MAFTAQATERRIEHEGSSGRSRICNYYHVQWALWPMETQMHVPEGTEDNQRHKMSGWLEVAKERMGAYGGSSGRDRIAQGQPNTVCAPPSAARHCCLTKARAGLCTS